MGTRRKRRSWSYDEKREIRQYNMVPGVSIAQVVQRYATSADQTHNWLKDARFALEPEEPLDNDEGEGFVVL